MKGELGQKPSFCCYTIVVQCDLFWKISGRYQEDICIQEEYGHLPVFDFKNIGVCVGTASADS